MKTFKNFITLLEEKPSRTLWLRICDTANIEQITKKTWKINKKSVEIADELLNEVGLEYLCSFQFVKGEKIAATTFAVKIDDDIRKKYNISSGLYSTDQTYRGPVGIGSADSSWTKVPTSGTVSKGTKILPFITSLLKMSEKNIPKMKNPNEVFAEVQKLISKDKSLLIHLSDKKYEVDDIIVPYRSDEQIKQMYGGTLAVNQESILEFENELEKAKPSQSVSRKNAVYGFKFPKDAKEWHSKFRQKHLYLVNPVDKFSMQDMNWINERDDINAQLKDIDDEGARENSEYVKELEKQLSQIAKNYWTKKTKDPIIEVTMKNGAKVVFRFDF